MTRTGYVRAALSMNNRNGTTPMLKLIDPATRGLAAATFLGMSLLATPLFAQTNSPTVTLAQNDATPATPPAAGKPAHSRVSRADRAEMRIKQLHDQLQITPAQETQWGAGAQAMRDDATAMQSVIAKRRQNRSTMTAVDDLRSYQEVTETHVAGLQKLIPAFQALYDSMSADQKKNADTVFGHSRRARGTAKPAQQ
jgi:periplasmic protein CpxP/Spy